MRGVLGLFELFQNMQQLLKSKRKSQIELLRIRFIVGLPCIWDFSVCRIVAHIQGLIAYTPTFLRDNVHCSKNRQPYYESRGHIPHMVGML